MPTTIRSAVVCLATAALGREAAVRRIPFGPLRGRRLCNSPQISIRMLVGFDEPWVTAVIQRELGKGAVAFDIGAHVGYTALAMASAGATVHAFELHPATAELLQRSVDANPDLRIQVHPVGLGRGKSDVRLFLNTRFMTSTLYADGEGAMCHIESLDDYRAEHNLRIPDFVKMDVERAEIDCLLGARLTLAHKPPLLIEFHTRELLHDGLELLGSYGYSNFTCEHQESLEGSDPFRASVLCRA